VPSTELADLAADMGLAAESCGSVEAAIARAFAVAAEEDAILISGSLYVAGEARSHLLPPPTSESRPG
jgi:folylpolyglutamate synthase/dihydropteroate synthase